MAARSYLTAPIAIIGIAGQLGGCPDLGALWQLLDSGRDAFTDGPPDRTGLANWPAHIPSRGAYLPDVAGFDAGFFGISPREAEVIDPQQRLLLETTWRALEDSGTPAESLADRAVGVYTGALWNDYESLRRTAGMPVTQHSAVGNSLDVLSARLSYFLRLHGPSLTVQSSCSSSLVALHLACAALASGEIEEALVGASNLILDPQTSEGLDLFGGLSPTGLCRPFAAGADGFVRGEGVLAVHLKPLAVALADGNDVHALIVASGVNNDGGGDSLATPNGAAQETLLREVYGLLGPDRERLVYVEAHGTGTRKGDPTEAGAIGRALGRPGRGLAIGSVKSSVGHLEPAAGLAGLLKTVLSLRHGRVPATVNCESPNPEIPFAELGLDVVRSPLELPSDPAPLLGVNSFGWGGTNAHVVLGPPLPGTARRPVGPAARRAGERAVDPAVGPATAEGPVTVRLSASSAAALEPVAQGWADRLDGCPEDEVRALAAAQAWQRSALPERCAVVLPSAAGDLAATAVRLCPAAAGQQDTPAGEETLLPSGARVRRGRAVSRGEVAFVFPGQGAQWAGMAAGLYAEWDVFRASFDRCAEALTPHLSTDVRELATRPDETDWLRRVELVQPALWAMMVSLADVWRACGVTPSIVVGHSQGEIAAACVAGALSLEDGATVVARRSALLHSLAGRGRMLAVHLPREDVLAALVDFAGQVDLAVHNGPTSCVVSGDPDAVLLLREILEADGVFCRLVDVDYASHGPQVEELAGEIESALRSISPRPATIPMLSTVDLEQVDGTALGPSYWVRNLRQPVRFAEAMAHLTARGLTHVVEVSPHPGLSAAIADTTREAGHEAVVIPTLRRDAGSVMDLTSQLAQAWVTGLPARGARPAGPHRATPPAYPFQRRRYWADPALEAPPATVEPPRRDAAQALGHTTSTLRVGPERQPWLRDHQLGSDAVLPAAFSLAAAALAGPARALRSVRLPEPLVLTPGDRSLAVDLHRGEGTRLTVWSRHDDVAGAGHAGDGRLTHLIAEVLDAEGCAAADGRPTGAQGRAGGLSVRGPAAVDLPVEGFYASCARRGVTYGPAFRVVQRIERGEGWVSARLRLPSRTPDFPGVIHPILLDGIMQPVLAIDDEDPRVLPARLEQLRFHGSGVAGSKEPSEETTLRELTVEAVRDDSGTFTVCGRTLDGEPVVSIHGLQLVPLRSDADTAIPRLEFALADATGEPDPAAGPSSDGTGDTTAGSSSSAARRTAVVAPDAEAADVRAVCLALGAEGTGPEALTLAEDGLDVVLVPGSGPEALRAVIRAVRELAHRPGDVRLAVVSRGALAGSTAPDPDAAALLGLVTVAQNEHPEQRIRMLDLDGELPAPELAALVRAWRARTDDLCAVRDGRLLRVVRRSRGTPGAMPAVRSAGTGEVPFRVVAGRSGEFGSVGCEVHRPPGTVGPGEVRVQILAASLNFRDVLVTQNALPPAAFGDNRELGLDAAGRVVEAGRDVHHVAVGDEVICCGRGLLASECVVPGGFVQRVPAGMSLPEAAALPMVLVTAWQGLVDLARVQPGETVLVHSAAGGLGLAAVHLAHALGARVIGTAGTSEKRALLRHLGVEVVANSRDASWAAAVRDAVPGGVDVVLNSLTGDMLALGLEVLAPGGRFIEVGKRDIYGGSLLGLRPLGKAVTIASVDVAGMLTDRPERFAALLEDAWKAVSERMVPALPVTRFPFARADDAFRALASGTVIGKVVLDDPSSVTGRVRPRPWSGVVAAGGCHVITGGLGAMGLALAEHLAGRGVRDVALLGRSAPGAAAAARVTALGALGVRVSVHACDVAERDQLAAALAEVRRRHGSIVAVHHTAGVLQDATLATTADADLAAVYHAKVGGARLLDELTSADPIEAFVLFSSAAVVIGSPGQGGYAAANACLDGLARRRRAEGRAGLSIQWPPVRGAGLGAESGGTARLADLGLSTLEPQDCGPILDRLLEDGEVCVSPMRLDVERWSESYPATVTRSSWAELPAGPVAARGGEGLASRLADLEPEHQRRRLVDVVTAQACRILRVTAGELDLDVPLRSVGLDSLMTLELRSALEREVGTRVSPTLLWTHGSPRAIASALSELVSSDPAARVGARVGPGPVAGPPR